MIQVQYQSSKGKITKYYSVNTFPCDTIIKLVQTGVIVTLNSVSDTELSINNPTIILDLMSPLDTTLLSSEG